MSLKVEVTNKILEKYTPLLEKNGINCICDEDYTTYSNPTFKPKYYRKVEIRTDSLPIGNGKGIDYLIAKKIAEKIGVSLQEYDLSRGVFKDEATIKNIFSVDCFKEDELEASIQKIMQAKNMLNEKYNGIADTLLS